MALLIAAKLRYEARSELHAGIAQLVERMICNLEVAGSIPAAGTILNSSF